MRTLAMPQSKTRLDEQHRTALRCAVLKSYLPARSSFDRSSNETAGLHYGSLEHLLSVRHDVTLERHLSKSVKRFYQRQNALIDRYAEVMEMKELNLDEKTQQLQRRVKLLTTISLLINIVLFVIKMVASILSNSLAVISSVIDSTVDLVSSVILYWTTRAIRHRNQYRYPAGRTRLEPLAIIILSVIMCSASVQVLSESTKRLLGYVQYITHRTDRMPEVNMSLQQPVPIIVMCITIVLKIVLYVFCRHVRVETIKALAQDHRNDVLSNSVALVAGLIAGEAFSRRIDLRFVIIDPIGAILISIYIIISWVIQATLHIRHLTGVTAEPDFLKVITWMAVNFSSHVTKIDMVKAFHFGTDLLVEVDIGLPGDMPIHQAHDIASHLQQQLEALPEIERAFVHIDYEFEHRADEHKPV